LLQHNSNTSRKLRLQGFPLGIENETPGWAVKPEEPACHTLHFLTKQTAIRFGCVTLVVSSAELMRAVRIIASYQSSAWQADFSGLTAKHGDRKQIPPCHGVAKSKSFAL